MKKREWILGIAVAFSMLLVVLISAVEAAIYSDFNFYEKEYEKYNVLSELEMEMEDVMHVTKEMMAYLHHARAELQVDTVVNGEARPFFNEREILHMEDVKDLFLIAMQIRMAAIVIILSGSVFLYERKQNWKSMLAKYYIASVIALLGIGGALGFLVSRNFSKYFVIFHELFFDNDLWLLDPKTELMIRMLPEGFFADFTLRIGIFVGIAIVVTLIVSILVWKWNKNKQNLLIN